MVLPFLFTVMFLYCTPIAQAVDASMVLWEKMVKQIKKKLECERARVVRVLVYAVALHKPYILCGVVLYT